MVEILLLLFSEIFHDISAVEIIKFCFIKFIIIVKLLSCLAISVRHRRGSGESWVMTDP